MNSLACTLSRASRISCAPTHSRTIDSDPDYEQHNSTQDAAEAPLPIIEYLYPPCVVAGHSPVTVYIMLSFPPGVLPPRDVGGWRLLAVCEGELISEFLVQPFAGDLVRCELLLAPHPGGVVFMMQGTNDIVGPPHTLLSLPEHPAEELNLFFSQLRINWVNSNTPPLPPPQAPVLDSNLLHRPPAPAPCPPIKIPATAIIKAQQEYSHALLDDPPHLCPPPIHRPIQGPGPPSKHAPSIVAAPSASQAPLTLPPALISTHSRPPRSTLQSLSNTLQPSLSSHHAPLKPSLSHKRHCHSHSHCSRPPSPYPSPPSSPTPLSPFTTDPSTPADRALRALLLRRAHEAVWGDTACALNCRIISLLEWAVAHSQHGPVMSPCPPAAILHSLLDFLYAHQLHQAWQFLVEHLMRAGLPMTCTPQGLLLCDIPQRAPATPLASPPCRFVA